MKTIIIEGFIFSYDVVKKINQKNRMIIRIKDKKSVVVSVNEDISVTEIEEALAKKVDFLKDKLPKTNKENIIHVRGVGYKPHFIVGNIPFVRIYGNEIVLCARSSDLKAYTNLLNEYYEELLKEELVKIISTARYDFREIRFPTISFESFTSRFADYDTRTNHIRLALRLAKYDPEHLKLTLYHELSHVFVPNHSKKFYEIFERKYPNAKALDLASRKKIYFDCL